MTDQLNKNNCILIKNFNKSVQLSKLKNGDILSLVYRE